MPVFAYSDLTSMTSGPIVPSSTGKSTDGLPSLKDRVASFSAITFSGFLICRSSGWLCCLTCLYCAKPGDYPALRGIFGLGLSHHHRKEHGIGIGKHRLKHLELRCVEAVEVPLDESVEHEVELEHAAAAIPADAVVQAARCELAHSARFTMRS